MKAKHTLIATLAVAALGFSGVSDNAVHAAKPRPPVCPMAGWSEGLIKYLQPTTPLPTDDTKNTPTPDCNFHEWSWEAFVWATALVTDPTKNATVPRFMTFPTPADLLDSNANAGEVRARPLVLAARAQAFHGAPNSPRARGPSWKPTATCSSRITVTPSMRPFT